MIGPALVGTIERWDTRLIVTHAPHVTPIFVDLLEGCLDVERNIGVWFGQR
jgi:hypothetical protein